MTSHAGSHSVHAARVSNPRAKKIRLVKLVDLSLDQEADFSPSDKDLTSCHISREQWTDLKSDILESWDPKNLESPKDVVTRWNSTLYEKGGQIALCKETGMIRRYAIYYFSTNDPLSDVAFSLDSISVDLRKLAIFALS